MSSMLYRLVFSFLLLAFPSYAQDSAQYTIHPTDTVRLSNSIGTYSEFTRPHAYDVWLKELVACEGLPMPPKEELDRIRFFAINSKSFYLGNDYTELAGLTYNKLHLIFFAMPYVFTESIVKHEYLHFVLWYTFGSKYDFGSGNTHPTEYFNRCGIR